MAKDDVKPPTLSYVTPPRRRRGRSNDPESRRWRHRRILFRVGLFVLLSPVTFYFGPNLILFRKLTCLAPADFVPAVQNVAVPIVRAAKEFQRDTGQMPESVKDLIPKYLPAYPGRFMGDVHGGAFVMYTEYGQRISYDFTPGAEGWSVVGPFANGPIAVPPVTLAPQTQGAPQH